MSDSILSDLNMLRFHVSRASTFDVQGFENDAVPYLEKIQLHSTPGPALDNAVSETRSCIAILAAKLRRQRAYGAPCRLEVLEARTMALAQIDRIALVLASAEISSPARTFGH